MRIVIYVLSFKSDKMISARCPEDVSTGEGNARVRRLSIRRRLPTVSSFFSSLVRVFVTAGALTAAVRIASIRRSTQNGMLFARGVAGRQWLRVTNGLRYARFRASSSAGDARCTVRRMTGIEACSALEDRSRESESRPGCT